MMSRSKITGGGENCIDGSVHLWDSYAVNVTEYTRVRLVQRDRYAGHIGCIPVSPDLLPSLHVSPGKHT